MSLVHSGRARFVRRLVALAVLAAAFHLGAADAASSQAREPGTVTIRASGRTFSTLRQAVEDAAPGDTLEVASGSYRGALIIGKPLTLVGIDTGGGLPVIDGGGARVAISLPVAGVTIRNFRITSSGVRKRPYGVLPSFSEEGCIVAHAGGHQIADNEISGCHYGVYLLTSDGTHVENNVITGNYFGGIFVRNSKRDVIRNNRMEASGYSGISVATLNFPGMPRGAAGDVILTSDSRPYDVLISEDIEIAGNIVTNHGHGGIGIGYARRVNMADNKVVQNGGAPVPRGSSPVELSASSKNVRGFGIGISCDAYDNKVTGNEVAKNINYGILIDTSYDNQVARNAVSESETGIQLFGAYGNVIEANKVRLNTGFGVRLERGAPINPPSVANLLYGNDLDANGVNAFDTSGKDRAPPQAPPGVRPKKERPLPADLGAPNRWDNGTIGNHYGDFDRKEHGFVDDDRDGIGERGHPIPGGAAVDHLPLTAERVLQAQTTPDGARRQASLATVCACLATTLPRGTKVADPSCQPWR